MIPDATLAWTSRAGMLDAIAGKDPYRTIVHHDRNSDRQLSLWLAQDGVNAWIQVDSSGHVIEHIQDRVPEIPPPRLGYGKIGMPLNQCLVDDIRHNVLLFHKTLLDLL